MPTNTPPLPSLDQLVADGCRRRFYRFFIEFWETIEAVDMVPNWHIEYLCDQLQEVYETWARKEAQPNMLVNVPPGTSKSTTITQLFPSWLWLKQPSIRIISSSYEKGLAIGHSIKSRDCVSSPKFQRLFPGLIEAKDDQDGKTDYRNTAGGQRFTASTGSAVTGNHADFIIIDDPIDPTKAASDTGINAAAGHLKKLATRKTDKARSVTIMVMQRLNEKDPAGIWLSSGRPLRHICLPGELTADKQTGEIGKQVRPAELKSRYVDGLLDPQRLSRSVLEDLASALGSYGYAGQVMQQPAPDEGGLIKKAWFDLITWQQYLALPGAQHATWNADADTAYTDKQVNDPSAVAVDTFLTNRLFLRYAGELRLNFPDLCTALPPLLQRNGFSRMSKLYVEPKATGIVVVQQMKRDTMLNVVDAPAPKDSKLTRVHAAAPFMEARRVVIIVDAPGAPPGWHIPFIDQCAAFPTAAHDDMLDCLTQAIARYNKPASAGYSFEF